MRGLALEGGGAKGAYHIGVVKALLENGCELDGFAGTSIGAINSAMLAQGDFSKATELWAKISMDEVFEAEDRLLIQPPSLKELRADAELPASMRKTLARVIADRGISTNRMKAMLEKYIDEERIRRSRKGFGLVTVSVKERRPYELMLADIPQGQLVDYIMASASFPGFRHERIGGNSFIDGAFYDNCPHRLLRRNGYDEIIVVRTRAPGVFRRVAEGSSISVIEPREDLGEMLRFSPENSAANMQRGYRDGLKFMADSRGERYMETA